MDTDEFLRQCADIVQRHTTTWELVDAVDALGSCVPAERHAELLRALLAFLNAWRRLSDLVDDEQRT